jgi:Na+/phosphate symporter
MRYVSAAGSFVFVFAGVFFLAGWFLMPYLPPVPSEPVSAFQVEYWTDNWIGAILGVLLGAISARSVLKKER